MGPPGPTPVRQNETPTTMGTHYKTGTCYFFSDCVLGGNRSMCLQTLVSTLRHLKSKFPFHPNFEAIKVVEKSVTIEPKQVQSEFVFKKRRNGIVTIFSPSFKEKETICYKLYNNSRSGENHTYVV